MVVRIIKLLECLLKEKDNKRILELISRNLNCVEVSPEFSEGHYIKGISKLFLKGGPPKYNCDVVKKLLYNKYERSKFIVTAEMLDDLKRYWCNNKNKYNLEKFKEIGIVYGDDYCIPDEVMEMLSIIFRDEILCNEEDNICYNLEHSYFLKLIFIIAQAEKEIPKLSKKKTRINTKRQDADNIIKYLMIKGIINDKMQSLNNLVLDEWLKAEEVKCILDFYQYIFAKLNCINIKQFLIKLSFIQNDPTKWMSKSQITFLLNDYLNEYTIAQELGLIDLATNHMGEIIRLSGEAWVVVNQSFPQFWDSKNFSNSITVTPDFEVLIPYSANPFLIYKISTIYNFEKNSNNDFFFVFNMKGKRKADNKIFTYKDFVEFLLSRVDNIPSIVKYDLENMK
jgi:hypothetical protein